MVISKRIYSLGRILFGLLAGYAFRIIADRSIDRFPIPIDRLRKGLQHMVFLFGVRPGQRRLVCHHIAAGGRAADSALDSWSLF